MRRRGHVVLSRGFLVVKLHPLLAPRLVLVQDGLRVALRISNDPGVEALPSKAAEVLHQMQRAVAQQQREMLLGTRNCK